jgi:hypothetical protein
VVNNSKPLSFHSISFGPATSTNTLRRMAQIALEVQNSAPRDPLLPATAMIDSSFAEALDTVRRSFTMLYILGVNRSIGSTRRDIPRNCGLVEKAQGFPAPLNPYFFFVVYAVLVANDQFSCQLPLALGRRRLTRHRKICHSAISLLPNPGCG